MDPGVSRRTPRAHGERGRTVLLHRRQLGAVRQHRQGPRRMSGAARTAINWSLSAGQPLLVTAVERSRCLRRTDRSPAGTVDMGDTKVEHLKPRGGVTRYDPAP